MIFKPSREFLIDQLEQVKANSKLTSFKDVDEVRNLESEIQRLRKRHLILSRSRTVVFVLIYASIVSNFTLPILTEVASVVTIITGVVGVGLLSVVVLYLTWRLGQIWNRMVIIGSRLFAIYEANSTDAGRKNASSKKSKSRKD